MTLAVDVTRALRRPHQLADLVDAVIGASTNDEADWIEWKSVLDLGARETHFTLARHIIGMANRRPAEAARNAEGCGYLIVGAEPGHRGGVTEVDPAVLDQGIELYLGTEGPGWSMNYHQGGGPSVLIVTVEAPRTGDRIFTLQRSFNNYSAGMIFVRRPGRTIQAGPGDVKALEDRYAEPLRDAKNVIYRQRLQEIGDALEATFEAIDLAMRYNPPTTEWTGPRNRLRNRLSGLEDRLPLCAEAVNQGTALQARDKIIAAREEIGSELRRSSVAKLED